MNIIDYDKFTVVIEDDTIALMLPNFYKENLNWMRLDIVLKDQHLSIGSIEFNFKIDSQNYYDYKGNISYIINKEYQGHGYATNALKLLKSYLCNQEINDKTLYVSTSVDNESSQKVALNNGGELCYEGDVPHNSVVRYLGKISQVKIYRIANM